MAFNSALDQFEGYIEHRIVYGKKIVYINSVRNNFQFSLHFLAEKFCGMKSFPYLCSVKKDEDGDLIGRHANAQRTVRSLRHFPSTLRRSLALKSNVLRLEGLLDGQSTRNGRAADGDQARKRAQKEGKGQAD